jgi:uncharacterized membrane protein YhiD involved in acid resistance
MDELIKEALQFNNVTPTTNLLNFIISLLTSSILLYILALTYIKSHSGYSYSKNYVHTLIFVGITITLIMIIIGSNIARAFALVGAMSIVRFRNPIKDSKDLVYIFVAMAIGMATGTYFYMYAVIFTIFFIILNLIFEMTSFGEIKLKTIIIKLKINEGSITNISSLLETYKLNYTLISTDKHDDKGNVYEDIIYEITTDHKTNINEVIMKIGKIDTVISYNQLVGDNYVSI